MKFVPKGRLLKIFTLSMLLLFTFTSIGFASSSTQFDYVALGDSLAAGVTPNNTLDKGYTDFIADKLDGEGVLDSYIKFAAPGAKTTDILAALGNANNIAAIREAEIITLDIGANDLLVALRTNPTQVPIAFQNTVSNITQIIGTLRSLNQDAKIYLMGYYNAFPYKSESEKEYLTPLIDQFNQTIQNIACSPKFTGVTYVDTYAIMDKHLAKYLPVDDIHPVVSGYRAIAKEFWNIIKVDFLRGLK